MPSKATAPWRSYLSRRFCLALLLSLLLHLFVVHGFGFLKLPVDGTEPTMIEARLVPLPPKPPAKIAARPAKPPKPVKRPQPQPAEPVLEPLPPRLPIPEPPAPSIAAPVAADAPAQPAPAVASEPPVQDTDADTPAGDPKPAPATFIESEYELRRQVNPGAEPGKIGVAHVSYKSDATGRYSIKSVAEATGIVSLFVSGRLRQESEGRITENGLQPERFLYQYGDNEAKAQHAEFDWAGGVLQLRSAKGKSSVRLVPGAQDLLSFMYQFMFTPPLEEMTLNVTNGKRLSTYNYSFEGEEQIRTGLGELKTMHISKSASDGKDRTDVWLAMDYQYIPVKIRKTEDNGSVIEEVVTRLSTDLMK